MTNYEQLHIPGSIQPHGVLLALSPHLEILQVSNNTQEYLGKTPEDLLGQPLSTLLNASQLESIQKFLQQQEGMVNTFKLSILTHEGEKYFDGSVNFTEQIWILELEPIDSLTQMSFLSFQALTSGAISKMQKTSKLIDFVQLVASEVRKITEFDRVMVYQFDSSGAGIVIAEDKREDLSPLLGLRYPATDIPTEARALYTRSLLRFIPSFHAQPVTLIPLNNPQTQQPLDLSGAALRSVHPCCVEYHQNMGVSALLVVPIIKERTLWGLISCHHYNVKYLTLEVRRICEFLGQLVSSELVHKVSQSEFDYEVKLKSLQTEFIESISQADNFREALISPEPRLLDLVNAKGSAVCLDNDITLVGTTPSIEEVRTLIEWADTQISDNLFSTNSLPQLFPEALTFKETASGLLLLRISKVRRYYILWFRPEVIQTVNWAGNPNEAVKVDARGSVTLSPRKSFEKWQETVRLTSLPWQSCELDSALALRNAIVGIVISKADELAKINHELEQSNRELASFAYAASHDLKEPLRGIYNYSNVLLEDYAHVLDKDGIDYLQTVVFLSQRMESLINALLRLSLLGQGELQRQAIDLNALLEEAIAIFYASYPQANIEIRTAKDLPTIECDPVLVGEVLNNLIINAFKYNNQADKWIEIGCLEEENQDSEIGTPNTRNMVDTVAPSSSESPITDRPSPMFYIRDNGIGIPEHHYQTIFRLFKRLHSQEKYGGGTGAGLAIAKKIVERHGGHIWVESAVGVGSTFYLTFG
ncbi:MULTISPECIES: ATP-binding protein [Nostocales]|uniref:histidine kinase n=3 Tax=Nostocales TaxID=1161 RepID=A0A0C1MYH2_9CYAN|nr:ATP-binding protein [Tolypothrix bouteillei]KAF3889118.1 GAF domain-containing protein [Tolypothrix bouteillei VB521301]